MKRVAATGSHPVERELDCGEEILWTGQPDVVRLCLWSIPVFLLAIPFTLYACFFLFGTLWAAHSSSSPFGHSVVSSQWLCLAVFGLSIVSLGAWLLCSPLIIYYNAKNTYYAVTNRRIIILRYGLTKTVETLELSSLLKCRRSGQMSRGDLNLTGTVNSSIDQSAASVPTKRTVALIGIEKPLEVDALIREQMKIISLNI